MLIYHLFSFQTCDIKAEGTKRFLTIKNVQLDQAGEVTYQALNAVTSAMLTVKGKRTIDDFLKSNSDKYKFRLMTQDGYCSFTPTRD